VSQSKTTGMSQHMRMQAHFNPRTFTQALYDLPRTLPRQPRPLTRDKQPFTLRSVKRASDFQPGFQYPDLIPLYRVYRAESIFHPPYMQTPVPQTHIIQSQTADLAHPESMNKTQIKQTTVTFRCAASSRFCKQKFHF
ncbi:hypothetical protein AAIH19_33650, partial [Pseudomonas aeruginosa]